MMSRRSQNNRHEINKRIRAQVDERRDLVFNSRADSSDTDNIKVMYNEIARRSSTSKHRVSKEFFSIYSQHQSRQFNSLAIEAGLERTQSRLEKPQGLTVHSGSMRKSMSSHQIKKYSQLRARKSGESSQPRRSSKKSERPN